MSLIIPKIAKSAFGENLSVPITNKITLRFDYNINTRQSIPTVTGSGSVSHSGTFAICSTGTTTGSTAELKSRDILKYNNGQGIDSRFTCIFDTPVAGTLQIIGLGNTTDGWGFGYDGTSFGVFRYNNGSKNFTASGSFSDDSLDGTGPSGMTITQTNLNVFRVTAQYLGGGSQDFFVESSVNEAGLFQRVHQINYTNQFTDTSVQNPSLPVFMYVSNGATTSDIEIKSASFSGTIQGIENFIGVRNGQVGSQSSVTTEINVLTIRNKSTYQSVNNRVPVLLDYISVSSDGPKIASFLIYLDATVTGASYTDQSTNTSVIEYSTTGGTISGGSLLIPIEIGKSANSISDLSDLGIIFYPGEQITVSAIAVGGGAGNAVAVGLSWKELF